MILPGCRLSGSGYTLALLAVVGLVAAGCGPRLKVDGRVTDPAGRPIEGVTVTYTHHRQPSDAELYFFVPFFAASFFASGFGTSDNVAARVTGAPLHLMRRNQSEWQDRTEADGRFGVSKGETRELKLRFEADGFHEKRLSYTTRGEDVTVTDLQVVLRPQPTDPQPAANGG